MGQAWMWISTCPLLEAMCWPLTSESLMAFTRRFNNPSYRFSLQHVHIVFYIRYFKACIISYFRVETEEGDYMFCFDNTFSTVSEKIIFFELILDNMDNGEDPEDWKDYVQGSDLLDMKLEDIMVRKHTHIEQ